MSETGSVTKPIQDALTKAGYFCMRLNSGLVKMGGRRIRLCPKGTADLVIYVPKELPIWVEAKPIKNAHHDKETLEAQAKFRDKVLAHGHQYVRATSLDDVLRVLEGMRKESK